MLKSDRSQHPEPDLEIDLKPDLKPDLGLEKQDSKCVTFWKTICCVKHWKNRCYITARQAKRGVALFCLSVYSFDVGSDLSVGFDLLNRCHQLTGKIFTNKK